jgi:nucleosome binding factor SPN SPT16 subunit
MEVIINAERFFQRLERLQTHWNTHKSTVWGGSDAICIPLGSMSDAAMSYSKSAAMHLYLLGYEFPDSIIIITRNSFHFMATAKKCSFLEKALLDPEISSPTSIHIIKREKDEGMVRESFNSLFGVVRKGGGKRLGSLYKGDYEGNFIPTWMEAVQQSQLETFEIAPSLGLFFAVKDETELVSTSYFPLQTNTSEL